MSLKFMLNFAILPVFLEEKQFNEETKDAKSYCE